MKKIAVIGGGASGLVASYFASKKNNKVTLFEKQKTVGRKILASGNGRCNISNTEIKHSKYNGSNPKIVNNIFSRFGVDETREFFHDIGIPFIEEKNGKLFPASLQASSVKEILEYEIKKSGVDVELHRKIDKIIKNNNKFLLETASKEKYNFDAVILSTGSCAYPSLGASKIGYSIAKSMNHTIIDPYPAILPINIPIKIIHRLQGIKWDSHLKVLNRNKKIFSSKGELLFTKYGISGPVSLDISRTVNELLLKKMNPVIIIDFFPDKTHEDLKKFLESLWIDKDKNLAFSLLGILKKRMPEVLLEMIGIDPETKISRINNTIKVKLVEGLKGLELIPGIPRNFEEAVVAAGGIDVNEINPCTMESKIIKGLYITGELLDIDGISGGFNLQFAWSTGALAGMAQ